jgi:hypothetical protein
MGTWTRRNPYNPLEPQCAWFGSFVSSRYEIFANFPRSEKELRFAIDHFKGDRVVLVGELAQVIHE